MGFIYKIQNKITKEIYIGQTKRKVFERWEEHLYNKNELSSKLGQAIIKYGYNNFSIITIEECENSILDEREKYWINYYDSFSNGYNATLGGEGKRIYYEDIINDFLKTNNTRQTKINCNCSISTVKKALQCYHIPYDDEEKIPIKIDQIDPITLKIINTYNSITDAANSHDGWNVSTLSGALSGYRKSAYGYYWQRHGDNKKFIPNKAQKERIAVAQYDKNNQLLNTFNSIADANRFLGKPQYSGSIGRVLSGKAKTAYGYFWKEIKKEK